MALRISVNGAEIAAIPARDGVAFVAFHWTRDDSGEELMLNAQVDRTVHALEPNDTVEVEVLANTEHLQPLSRFNGEMGSRPTVVAAVDIEVNGTNIHRAGAPPSAASGSVMVVVREVRGKVAIAIREGNEQVAATPLSAGDRAQIRLKATETRST